MKIDRTFEPLNYFSREIYERMMEIKKNEKKKNSFASTHNENSMMTTHKKILRFVKLLIEIFLTAYFHHRLDCCGADNV